MQSEKQLQNDVIFLLKFKKIPVFRQNAGTWQDARSGSWIKGQDPGCADIICGYPVDNLFLLAFIEMKAGYNKLSLPQIAFLRDIHKAGIPWLVCRDMSDLDKWLADKSYHGSERDTDDVLNENKRFVPSAVRKTGEKRMSMSTVNQFVQWSDKHGK